ncbi:MAG: hypothetical protein SVZ03_12355 [Spirochaetota bacterium]|nr:hypothetical protein [Spirochaetota bacterium]
MNNEYMPENNLVILLLLILLTAGLYYFWWLARASKIFNDDPAMNILLVILTIGIWGLYINLKYMQKSEEINGRDMKWYLFLFLPISFLIIQHNINERYFPGK